MSTDFDLKCKTCGQAVETVASSSIAYGDKLWTADTNLEALRAFLFSHRGHELVFDDCQKLDDEETP